MPGKGLVPALLIALCLLVGCGGGGEQGQGSTASSQGSATSPAQAKSPESVKEAAAQLKDSADQIKRERQGQTQGGQGTGSGNAQGKSPDHGQTTPLPPARPQSTHHDSGGGTAPFATKSGDNSIQESGKEGSPSETQAAAAVLHAYLDARVAHRWADACFYLSAGYAATIEAFAERYGKGKGAKSCAEVLEGLASGSSQQALVATAHADVGALRIEGDHGFLLYHGASGEALAMPVVLEGGAWKVGSLDGAPLG